MILGHKWGGRRSGKEVFLLVEVVFWGNVCRSLGGILHTKIRGTWITNG